MTVARHRLRAWLDENAPELDPVARADLEVAWSEACSNVVRHAYGPAEASFDATAHRVGNELRLTVRDTGQWRPPGSRSGGRGLPLMEQLSDELVIDRQADSTTVTMVRQLPAGGAGTAILAPMTEEPSSGREIVGGAVSGDLASVTTTEHGASLVLTISGEVDISNIDSIAEAIHGLPNTEDGLLIDLSAVSYLDSSAVSLLHDVAMRLRSRAQRLIVVSPPQTPPRRILDLTALYVNAPVVDALESGIKLLSSGGNAPP